MLLKKRSVSGQRKSLDRSRRSEDLLSTDSTLNYMWQYSQSGEAGQQFNPSEMNDYVNSRRKEREQRLFSSTQPPVNDSQDVPSAIPSSDVVNERIEKTKLNIKKSLKLLDETVSSPRQLRTATPLLREAGTPAPLLRGSQQLLPRLKHSSYTPSGQSSIVDGDYDLPAPITLMDESGYTKPVTPTGQFFLEDIEDKTTDVTLANSYSEKDTVETAYDTLQEDFAKSLTSLAHSSQVFELVDQYEKLCSNTVMAIYKFTRKTTPGRSRFSKRITLMDLMNQEKYTWRLISSLYSDKLENQIEGEKDFLSDLSTMGIGQSMSDKEIIEALYRREASTRHNQIVIDWLEKNNEDWLERFIESQNVEYFGGVCTWENTLHYLQQSDSTTMLKRPFVTEMDPDAPVRQNRPIAELDLEDEKRLLQHVFAYIRSGKLAEAQDLCVKCGQAWRAAAMDGWKLYHNPNTRGRDSSNRSIEPVEGNPSRDLWKKCCWNCSEQDTYVYERAIYAALVGNLGQLLQVCMSWEDYLWAYFKVMVDVRVEQELRTMSHSALETLPSDYWDQVLTPETIFKQLHASSNEDVRESSKSQFHVIQKYLILNNLGELIEEVYNWLRNESVSSQIIRFMAHFVLFLRSTGLETKDSMSNAILEAFVECLIQEKQLKLVALYTSYLPHATQIAVYARFLEEITGKDERRQCFELGERYGLDMVRITKTVVENIRGKDDFQELGIDSTAVQAATSEEDRKKIAAIEWLVFDPSQRVEAIKQSNAIMRCFLALRKHDAARNIFDKLPEHSIDVVHRQWQMRAGDAPLPPQDSNSVREYLCIKAYLDALETFNVWFEHFHRNAPREPVVKRHASFTEKVAFEHEQKQYEEEKERWKRTLDLYTKETTLRIHNVLLFPGGWLIDLDEEDEPRESRVRQLILLRQLCIPFVTFLLQSVLSSTNQHKECLQLADLIASPRDGLYKVFRKDELRQLLSLLRQSSIKILETHSDPLGYGLK